MTQLIEHVTGFPLLPLNSHVLTDRCAELCRSLVAFLKVVACIVLSYLYARKQNASRVLPIVWASVRLSVRLSVCLSVRPSHS